MPDITRRNFKRYDNTNGQLGVMAPTAPGWSFTAGGATTANQARFVRLWSTDARVVTSIKFHVTTASASDDPIDVGIYNAALDTKLGSSGAVTGQLNNGTGWKTVNLTAPVTIAAGVAYYLAASVNNAGTPVLAGAAFVAGGNAQAFGATAGIIEGGIMAAAHPLPAAIVPASSSTPWVLVVV